VVEDVGEEVARGARRGEAQISEDWRMKWRWWFLRANRIGTRNSTRPTPPTSTQRWQSGSAAASDVRASELPPPPVALLLRWAAVDNILPGSGAAPRWCSRVEPHRAPFPDVSPPIVPHRTPSTRNTMARARSCKHLGPGRYVSVINDNH
jgi:hypothetical protein